MQCSCRNLIFKLCFSACKASSILPALARTPKLYKLFLALPSPQSCSLTLLLRFCISFATIELICSCVYVFSFSHIKLAYRLYLILLINHTLPFSFPHPKSFLNLILSNYPSIKQLLKHRFESVSVITLSSNSISTIVEELIGNALLPFLMIKIFSQTVLNPWALPLMG